MLKFQKDLTSSFWVFAPTRKRDAGQNPGVTKIPLPLRAGDKKGWWYGDQKCHQNNSPVVCDGYVKYEEAEVDRLVAILKTNNSNGRPCGIIQ